MNMIKRTVCFLMIFLLLLNISPLAIAVSQSDIDLLKERKEALAQEKADKQAEVDALRSEEASLLELKLSLDKRNAVTIEELELIAEEISLCSEMIEEKHEEAVQAKELELQQLERYRSRIRAMEENGEIDFIAIILSADSITGLLSAIDDAGEIMEYDRKLHQEYILARENAEAAQAEYVSAKAELEEKQARLKLEQSRLEEELGETILVMKDLEERLLQEEGLLQELEGSIASTQADIDRMVAELEAERKRREEAAAASGGGGGGGSSVAAAGDFSWPCPSTTYVTSPYGPRYHPVTGLFQSTHTGLDIGASWGSAIACAGSGTVSFSGVKGGYGNCVMVDHGGGVYTLYAHMSSIAVSSGTSVSSGDTLGYVGDTGLTSGPHLHFEIRIDGACVDPAPYFSGLVYI